MFQYKCGHELLDLCSQMGTSLAEISILSEAEESGLDRNSIWEKMEHLLDTMEEAIRKGLQPGVKTMGGLIGGNAFRLSGAAKGHTVCGPSVVKAASYALAVSEINAAMGRIVAAPTAGASGILPGCLLAVKEEQKLPRAKVVEGLFAAGAVGRVIANNATLSGAEGGCQAECGSAAAMAAAAVVSMAGGPPSMSLDAAAMALKGSLGLVCDPVAGLVEVPCSKRNATGTAVALICADMALAGICSFIPFDEMVEAMMKVGRMLPADLRETARGGCAATPSALEYLHNMRKQHPE